MGDTGSIFTRLLPVGVSAANGFVHTVGVGCRPRTGPVTWPDVLLRWFSFGTNWRYDGTNLSDG